MIFGATLFGLELIVILKIALVSATLATISHFIQRNRGGPRIGTDNNRTIRQSDVPRRQAWGRCRVGTIVADIFISDIETEEQETRMPYILCEGVLDRIEGVFFDNNIISFKSTDELRGHVVRTGDYEDLAYVKFNIGAPDQTMSDWAALSIQPDRIVGSRERLSNYIPALLGLEFNPSGSRLPAGGNYLPKIQEDGSFYFKQPSTRGIDFRRRRHENEAGRAARIAAELEALRATFSGWMIEGSLVPQAPRLGNLGFGEPLTSEGGFIYYDVIFQREKSSYHFGAVPETTLIYYKDEVSRPPPEYWYHFGTEKIYIYDEANREYVFWGWLNGSRNEDEPPDAQWWSDKRISWENSNEVGLGGFWLDTLDFNRLAYDPDRPYLANVAYLGMSFKYDRDAFGSGFPEVSAVVRGLNNIYDPRTDEVGWSENPVLCLAAYMSQKEFGLNIPNSGAGVLFDEANLKWAANECDKLIETKSGEMVKRYVVGGITRTDDPHLNNIRKFLVAMGGTMNFANGKWWIYPGIYRETTDASFKITRDMIVDTISVKHASSRRERANTVQGIFSDANADYETAAYPTQQNADDVERDGQVIPETYDLEMVTSYEQAQRLAKIRLAEIRKSKTLELRLDARALEIVGGDIVRVELPHLGITSADPNISYVEFYVLSTSMIFDRAGAITYEVSLREYGGDIYEWDKAEEIVPEPVIKEPAPQTPPQPITPDPVVEDDEVVEPCSDLIERLKREGIDPTEIERQTSTCSNCDASFWAAVIDNEGNIETTPGTNIGGSENVRDRN